MSHPPVKVRKERRDLVLMLGLQKVMGGVVGEHERTLTRPEKLQKGPWCYDIVPGALHSLWRDFFVRLTEIYKINRC